MSDKLATTQLRQEIVGMVVRYGQESDITVYEALGAIEIAKLDIVEMLERKQKENT